jgi:peptidase S46-like protein
MPDLATRFALLGVLWVSGAAAQAQNPLAPPPSAQRVAQRTTLQGNELGTMWTFENPPLEAWKSQHNFTATPEWLADVRLSSVRFGESCSASFVSPNGLVMTNHHCARECVEAVSNQGTDYVVNGFYAATRQDEKLCPGLFLDQLVEIENVTTSVQRAVSAVARGANARMVAEAQEAAIERLQEDCQQRSRLTCEVVTLYRGGQFQMYKYRRYTPVKLVFAPELQAGFFGGDPDNFTFPRYDLDVSFVRAYEAGGTTPVRSANYFRWRAEGAREGELVFVTGNPGSTSRQIPFSEVMYEKIYRQPFLIQLLDGQRQILQGLVRRGPQFEQQVRQQLFEIENSLKSYQGQFAGLQDSLLLGRKLRWETEFRGRVNADARLKSQYGDVWDKMADLQLQKMRVSPRLNISNPDFVGAPHVVLAAQLVGYLTALSKPEAERPEEYRGESAARTEQLLRSPVPLDPQLAQSLLVLQIAMAQRWLEPTDALLADLIRPNETPEQAATRLAAASKILDAGFRQTVLAGKASGLPAVNDPFVRLARAMAGVQASLAERWPEIQALERLQEERLAKAMFAVFGTKLPPDATFTLRITDGIVKGYTNNGTSVPPFTTISGMFERSAQFNNKDPFTLPKSFEAARSAINLSTPFNFVSTTDITGGNSGSPVIDREGRVVGVAFDSNMEALPNEFVYRNETGRTVSVHTAGITEALRSIYKAEALLRELTGQAAR